MINSKRRVNKTNRRKRMMKNRKSIKYRRGDLSGKRRGKSYKPMNGG